MSEQQQPDPEAVELAPGGFNAFGELMDALAPEPDEQAEGAQGTEVGGAAAPAGTPDGGGDAPAGGQAGGDAGAGGAAGTEGGAAGAQPGAGGDAPQGDAGAAAGAPAGDAAAGGGAAGIPADWTASADAYLPKLGELSTALEENTQKAYREESLAAVRTEHAQYFTALEKHPRLLVGTQVPKIDGTEGMETLQSTQDAKDWQDAVKQILVEEVNARASVKLDENKDFLQNIHQSIDLFKNNRDLIPGTKDFDIDLANRFAEFAKPYELRVDGKLQGYTVPVQPMIDHIREQVIKDRAAAPPASSPAGGAPAQTQTQTKADPPQAGVASKAGSSEQKESFETLFGTIGLPNLQI